MKSIIHQSWPVSGTQGLKQSYKLVSNGSLQLNYHMLLKLKTLLESKRLRIILAEGSFPDLCIFHNTPSVSIVFLLYPFLRQILNCITLNGKLALNFSWVYYSLWYTRRIRSMCKWRISLLLNDVHWCNHTVFLAVSLCLILSSKVTAQVKGSSTKVKYPIEVLFYVLY